MVGVVVVVVGAAVVVVVVGVAVVVVGAAVVVVVVGVAVVVVGAAVVVVVVSTTSTAGSSNARTGGLESGGTAKPARDKPVAAAMAAAVAGIDDVVATPKS